MTFKLLCCWSILRRKEEATMMFCVDFSDDSGTKIIAKIARKIQFSYFIWFKDKSDRVCQKVCPHCLCSACAVRSAASRPVSSPTRWTWWRPICKYANIVHSSHCWINHPNLTMFCSRQQLSKERQSSLLVLRKLWHQEGYRLFYKGLTARLSYSAFYSVFIICGYETVKRLSLKPEYKHIFYSL